MAPEFITKREFANTLRIHVRTLERTIKRGGVKVVKIGGSVRIPWSELAKFLSEPLSHRSLKDLVERGVEADKCEAGRC